MKTEEQTSQITGEASDSLGSPDSQEESDDNWSPDQLSAEDRTRYDTAVKAVDQFIEAHPTYKQTDENQQAILDYLDDHALAISPASLELCWEQLQDRLDLADQPEAVPPKSKDEDASVRLATAALARRSNSDEEPPEVGDGDREPEEQIGRRGKAVGWRNGRRLDVGA